jgi:acyl-CoA dehydrogenase
MAWDFETEPAFQAELDWMTEFVREEVEPLEHVLGSPWNIHDPRFTALVRPLQRQVRERRLWACTSARSSAAPATGRSSSG